MWSSNTTPAIQTKPSSDTSVSVSDDFDGTDIPQIDLNFTEQQQRQQQQKQQQAEALNTKFCNLRRCICLSILIGGATIVATSLIITNDPNPLNYFVQIDPPGTSEASRWDAISGLSLVVENAVDDTWYDIVESNIQDWNQSDAVTLTSVKIPYEYDCEPRNGRLKICNGDYGDTDWHGINIALVDNTRDLIVHSISKLNDRMNASPESRAYITCHEQGHGLGLPHTDEDHFNKDRGNDCMDYTTRPQNNLIPGTYNLNLLKELYGTPTSPIDPNKFLKNSNNNADGDSDNSTPSEEGEEEEEPPFRYTNKEWDNNDKDKDDKDDKDKDKDKDDEKDNKDKDNKDKDDDRRNLRGGDSQQQSQNNNNRHHRYLATEEEIFQAELDIQHSCKEEYCNVPIDNVHSIKVTKFKKMPGVFSQKILNEPEESVCTCYGVCESNRPSS